MQIKTTKYCWVQQFWKQSWNCTCRYFNSFENFVGKHLWTKFESHPTTIYPFLLHNFEGLFINIVYFSLKSNQTLSAFRITKALLVIWLYSLNFYAKMNKVLLRIFIWTQYFKHRSLFRVDNVIIWYLINKMYLCCLVWWQLC